MSTVDLSRVLDNLRTVLDCPEPVLEAANPDLTERLRQLSNVAKWNKPGPSPQIPPDFVDCLEPEIRSYCWGWTGVTPFAPDVIEPGLMEPPKPDDEARGPTSSIPISRFGSLAPSLIAQRTVSQVTRDLNRLVEEGALSPALRELILTGRPMGGDDPCQEVGTGKPPGQLPMNLPQLNSNVYTHSTAPFGGGELSARLNTLLPALQKLTSATQAQVRFSSYTGLPRTLRGDLTGPQERDAGTSYQAMTTVFVTERAEALVGAKVTTADDKVESFGRTARLRQIVDGIPVYGGVLISSFDKDGILTYVNNSFYPIPQEERFGNRFLIGQQDAFEIAAEYVRVRFLHPLKGADEAPRPSLETSSGDEPNGDGKIIFPALISDGRVSPEATLTLKSRAREEAAYLPAWLVTVREPAAGRAWSVVVDAERTEGPLDPRILAASENLRGTSVKSEVTATVLAALGQVSPPRTLVELADTPSGDLKDAPSFELTVAQQEGGYVAASVNGGDPNTPRFANTYFHLTKALGRFKQIVVNAWPDTPESLPDLPGQTNRLLVKFELEPPAVREFGSQFTWDTKVLRFGHGTADPKGPTGDPTSDPDVIYHEYTHAVLDLVQPDLHPVNPRGFEVAIDEGLAFYYACSLTDHITRELAPQQVNKLIPYRWGKVSHQDPAWTDKGYRDLERAVQVADHDFFRVYGVFPAYNQVKVDDPDHSKNYACSMICARTLWDVRRVLGAGLADAIILRATHLAGGVQSDVETLAEAIIHVDREMAAAAGRASHESALRLVFCSRGVLADSPVNELRTISLSGQQLILAAAEITDPSGSQPGCLISSDGGQSWVPLGIGGPGEVVAMATLESGQNHEIIWAAAETQVGQSSQQLVYRYDLTTDAMGAPVTGGTWSTLPPLAVGASILTMASITSANGTPWLFVGTERGIYKFDGTGWPAPAAAGQSPEPNWGDMTIFDLAVATLAGSHMLLSATNDGPRVLKINDPATNTAAALTLDEAIMPGEWLLELDTFPTLALSRGTDGSGQSHLFAGTSDRGLFHWDPALAAPGWTTMPSAGMVPGDPTRARPIFCVLPAWRNGAWEIAIGTDNGVYRKTGNGDWTPANIVASPNAESVENTSVVAMYQAGTTLLAGTGQRGLWRQEQNGQWARVTQGLPRLGRLSDTLINERFTGVLAGQDTGTHVLLVSQTQPALSLETEVDAGGSVDNLELFYVAPYVDLNHGHLAGLQAVALTPAGLTQHTASGAINPGFYLVVVRAGAQGATYRVKIDFKP